MSWVIGSGRDRTEYTCAEPQAEIFRGAAWLVCSCIARSYSATWGDRKKSNWDGPFCPGNLEQGQTRRSLLDTDPVERFGLHDLDGWGWRVQEAWRIARFGRVSIFFRAVCRKWPRGPGTPVGRRAFGAGPCSGPGSRNLSGHAIRRACLRAAACQNFPTPKSV